MTTFGSLGDLHPYLVVGLSLQELGHEAVIATSEYYRAKVEALGLTFRPVRPDHPEPTRTAAMMREIMDLRRGPEVVVRQLIMPFLRDSFEDTLAAAAGADLLVSHPLSFTTSLVAEQKGLPWASTVLSPLSMFSEYDPPVLPGATILAKLRFLGPAWHRWLFRFGQWTIRSWTEPWHRLRADLGLPAKKVDPLFAGQHSPALVLALFSEHLACRQPDWPPQTVVTGFPFFDSQGSGGLSAELSQFLKAGPPPLVFTLGSSAVHDAGQFYEHSAAAAKRLGQRAVLVIGSDPRNRSVSLSDGIIAVEYAPFSELFARAAAIVHQGGVGTTGQAMRAGRPMLVMPYAHDQPDNAERVRRLGIGRVLPRHRYSTARAATELRRLLDDPAYARRAAEVGAQVSREDGARSAAAALARLLEPGPQRQFPAEGAHSKL